MELWTELLKFVQGDVIAGLIITVINIVVATRNRYDNERRDF